MDSVMLTPDQIRILTSASKVLQQVDHYLKHGSISDRHMAGEAREEYLALKVVIDQDNARRQMGSLIA